MTRRIVALVVLAFATTAALIGVGPVRGQGFRSTGATTGAPGVNLDVQMRSHFVENRGQLGSEEIHYFTRSRDLEVGFARGRVLFHALRWEPGVGEGWRHTGGLLFTLKLGDGTVLPEGRGTLAGRSHYLLGSDREGWIRGARHLNRILYRGVYRGIDLVFLFDRDGRLTYEFLVAPGADPSSIALRYESVETVRGHGAAVMEVVTDLGVLRDGELVTYQEVDGVRRIVASSFRQLDGTSYGLEILGEYDPARQLIVDPTIQFSSYWGSGPANNRTVQLDSSGNIYMSGGTSSTTWPTTAGAYDTTHSGAEPGGCTWPDVTAAKFDATGNVIWSTFIGGLFEDYAYVSAVNQSGELYLAGRAGSGYPTTVGAFDRTFNGGSGSCSGVHAATDAFVTKLSANGDDLLYSTYIGGGGNDNGRAIHLLPTGELLVGGGNTTSTDLPSTPADVYKPNRTGNRDSWVAKVSADGSSLGFLTYFGPGNDTTPDETIRALGVDSSGNVWIGGTTTGSDLVTTAGAFQSTHAGGVQEAYIAKLSADGKNLVYLSWIGGSGFDEIETEGVSDAAGNFYVAGSTASTNFPTTPGAFQTTLKGASGTFGGDGWVARINNDGSLGFATLFGGSSPGPESLFGPVVDAFGQVYVTGRFHSDDCKVTPDAFQSTKADPGVNTLDAFLAVFSSDGQDLLYGTYLGGTETDQGRHLGIHPNGGQVVIVGETNSTDLPLVSPPQSTASGAFLASFDVVDLGFHTLAVTRPGGGSGSVTSDPAGVDCGSECQADFVTNTLVLLDAVPDPGSEFTAFGGDAECTGGTVTMDADYSCTATFEPCSSSEDQLPPQTVTETETFVACNTLRAGAGIGGFVVGAGADVTFRAGVTIELQDGLEVGGLFRAENGPP